MNSFKRGLIRVQSFILRDIHLLIKAFIIRTRIPTLLIRTKAHLQLRILNYLTILPLQDIPLLPHPLPIQLLIISAISVKICWEFHSVHDLSVSHFQELVLFELLECLNQVFGTWIYSSSHNVYITSYIIVNFLFGAILLHNITW